MDNEEVYSIKVEEFRMKKSTVIKLLAILMTVCMLLSFIACDKHPRHRDKQAQRKQKQ